MPDLEIDAMSSVAKALDGLDPDGQRRVLSWAADRFGVQLGAAKAKTPSNGHQSTDTEDDDNPELDEPGSETAQFEDFADLFNAAQPKTDTDKALVAGYWFQIVQKQPTFTSQPLNTALKHLGHPLSNITKSMTVLMRRKPTLVMQTKKAGNSQQARKTYKLTAEGVKTVAAMLG